MGKEIVSKPIGFERAREYVPFNVPKVLSQNGYEFMRHVTNGPLNPPQITSSNQQKSFDGWVSAGCYVALFNATFDSIEIVAIAK